MTADPAPAPLRVIDREMRATSHGEDGIFHLAVRFSAPPSGWIVARVGTIDFTLIDEAGDGWFRGRITLEDVQPEEPPIGGRAALYPVTLFADARTFELGRIGF